MEKEFWGLGDRFWMQFIDGKFHQYGSLVFDENLHGKGKEPGYLNSLREGAKLASECLGEKLSLHFYKELHKKLCQHFKGFENQTEISKDKTGTFKEYRSRCLFPIKELTKEAQDHYYVVHTYKFRENFLERLKSSDFNEYQRICSQFKASKQWIKEYREFWKNQSEKSMKK